MKIVIIGASGHVGITLPSAYCADRDFAAVAPGSMGENMEGILCTLRNLGYTPTYYEDYREMLGKEQPDVAVVDNFYGEHGPVILDAFKAGCHVFAEKPIASDLEELDQIEQAYKEAGTHFASMFTFRYHGLFCRAKALIDEGAIGKVRLLNAQKSYKYGTRPDFMSRRESYGGTIPWVGIHGIDWILWMSGGRFEAVSAVQSAAEAPNGVSPETTALVQYRMNDGMMASLTMDYLNPAASPRHGDDRIRVVGTLGTLEVREGEIILINKDGVQKPEPLPTEKFFEDFLKQVRGEGQCKLSAEEVFAATRGALMAQKAADTGELLLF